MICSKCKSETDVVKSLIKDGQIIEGCEKCIYASAQKGSELSAKHYREAMKTAHRKDLIQPIETEFVKAYPEKAKEMFSDDVLRRYG